MKQLAINYLDKLVSCVEKKKKRIAVSLGSLCVSEFFVPSIIACSTFPQLY